MTAQEILLTDTTKTRKMEMLFDLGLSRREVSNLMGVGYGFAQNVYARKFGVARRNSRHESLPDFSFIFNRNFGIEIEAFGIQKRVLADKLREEGIEVNSESYNHATREHWKIVNDGSIQGENSFELVSPILNGASGLEQIKKVCKVLKSLNAKINKSCGLHVHFSMNDMKIKNWKNLFYNYAKIETLIDKMMPESRRENANTYCRSLRVFDWESKIEQSRDLRGLSRAITNGNRYFKLNAEAYWRHRTVEFRQHAGTIEFKKIQNWILFAASLVEYSKNNRIATADETGMRCFLNEELSNYYQQRKESLAA